MKITVSTSHPVVALSLTQDPPAGVRVDCPPIDLQRGIGPDKVLEIVLTCTLSTGLPPLLQWLLPRLKEKKRTKIRNRRREIECDEEGRIRRIVEEEFEQDSE